MNINLNTVEDLERLKRSFNMVVESKIADAKMTKAADEVKCGSVGELKYIFESISNKLFNSKSGKKAIKNYVKTIKENKDLNQYYKVFETIKSSNGVKNSETFISESAKLCNKVSESSRKKLSNILNECVKCAKISDDELYSIVDSYSESVDAPLSYILSEGSNTRNIVEYSNAINEAVNRLGDKSKVNEVETRSKEELMSDLNNEINEATEEFEKNVIEDISLAAMKGQSNKDLFENYKSSCISILDEISTDDNIENKGRFFSMKEGIEKKEFNESTFIDDMLKLSELKETLKETI